MSLGSCVHAAGRARSPAWAARCTSGLSTGEPAAVCVHDQCLKEIIVCQPSSLPSPFSQLPSTHGTFPLSLPLCSPHSSTLLRLLPELSFPCTSPPLPYPFCPPPRSCLRKGSPPRTALSPSPSPAGRRILCQTPLRCTPLAPGAGARAGAAAGLRDPRGSLAGSPLQIAGSLWKLLRSWHRWKLRTRRGLAEPQLCPARARSDTHGRVSPVSRSTSCSPTAHPLLSAGTLSSILHFLWS